MMKPTTIFLIDGIGAISSTIGLCIVLYFQALMGMPEQYLYVFIGIALLLAVYSLSCYYFSPLHWKKYLHIVCIANLLYSVLTAFAVYKNYSNLLWLGKAYFILEIAVILLLCRYEYHLLSHVSKK